MHRHSQQGFTLTELILTLVIIGVISAVAIPRFFQTSSFEQRGFTDEIINALRYAQQYAVKSHCGVRVQISATGYALFRPANPTDCGSTSTGDMTASLAHPVKKPGSFTGTAPDGVSLSAHDFIYTPLGTATATQTISVGSSQIRVEADSGYTYSL